MQPQDLSRLDLQRSLPTAVSLIEWAERLGDLTPDEHLALNVTIISQEERNALLDGGVVLESRHIDEEEESEEEDEEDSDDVRWRKLEIIPKGERWVKRVEDLQRHVSARGCDLDLYLLRPLTVAT